MRIFLDSGAFIAYNREQDLHHNAAVKFLDSFSDENVPTVTSNHVVEEVVTYLQAREGREKAFFAGQRLLENRQLSIIYVNENHIRNALTVVRKRDGLSLCDALTATMMEEEGIQKLCSFDSDFDQFKHIQRLH
ncbi:type II toxin-antitoxin system VapC family toxin [Candidatus Micrarchaeota archaeon]|nr:type II toxin-antitoxin system VapC family toxin [Candidatus Micrarchaeota archaeon]